MTEPGLDDVRAARRRFDDESVVRETPVEVSRSLSDATGGDVHVKMEHLQRTGSFKVRGAYNKLTQVAADGTASRVVAASAGNHAQGVALAATKVGLDSTVVMPTNAPQAKVDATRGYGADVVLEGSDFAGAMAHARDVAADGDTLFVHAYDDPDIVAGQGTIGLEIREALPEVDCVVVPVGGGGLIAGVAAALAGVDPGIRVVGVQAASAATVPQSLDTGEPCTIADPETIADGIATGGISELTYSLIEAHVDGVVTVSDDEIAKATLILLERAKQLVEGAGAASVAALLDDDLDVSDETVVPVLSGGNVDISTLQTVLDHALADRDQLLQLRVRIDDQPGKMTELSGIAAEHGANIRDVRHDRTVDDLAVGEAYLSFELVAGGTEHARSIVTAMEEHGYEVERVN